MLKTKFQPKKFCSSDGICTAGFSDPYVNGQFGSYKFQTKVQKKTLTPKWHEEFKIPIFTWESSNIISLELRDKDHFGYDTLGFVSELLNIHKMQILFRYIFSH